MGNQPNFNKNLALVQADKKFTFDLFGEIPLFNIQEIQFPLSTRDIKIVDAKGRRVKLAGGNWSGAHMCRHCVDGLECRPMKEIAMDIRYKFKMNCVRLTYSMQMFFQDKKIPQKFISANPELIGKTGMEIFDITIQTLTDVGLMVILNNHTSTSQWCCSNQDGDGLWWTRKFPQNMFFQCTQAFAKRYKDNPRVIGIDLRNELRKAHGMSATWGDGNPLTDWKRAAKICSDIVQTISPHWLIFVSGLDYQLDLTGVYKSPLELKVPNKLVYTGHFYGFSWVSPQITSWNMVSYQSFREKFFNTQTFVRALGYPYFLGEFGNNNRDIPWKYLIRYLKETDIDWTYWALDGFKCQPKEDQTYGVFTNDFSQARHPDLLEDMISVGPPPGTIIERTIVKKTQKPGIHIGPKLQLYSPMQKNEAQTKLVQTTDAKFLLSGVAIRNSLEVGNQKSNLDNNDQTKVPLINENYQYHTGENRFVQREQHQEYRQVPTQTLFKQTFQKVIESPSKITQPSKQKLTLVQSKKITKTEQKTLQQTYQPPQSNPISANEVQNTGQGYIGGKYQQLEKNTYQSHNLIGGVPMTKLQANSSPLINYVQLGGQSNTGNVLNYNSPNSFGNWISSNNNPGLTK